jgi:hypothetical protein
MKYVYLLAALVFSQAASAQTNRTALIIGVGEYGYAGAPPLDGVKYDMFSAQKIANAMGIDDKNIKYLKNSEATKENIIKALNALGESTTEGSKAFVYFSGHGTRQQVEESCVEGLLTYEGQTISNQEFAKATQKLVKNADKLVTMIDACHAGGVAPPVIQNRSMGAQSFTPKFFMKSGGPTNACSLVSNMKTRGLLPEVTRLGGLQENFVQITAARPDEQSLDQPGLGGVATQALRDCLLGKAKDLNSSGAISMSEIQQCAQNTINDTLKGNPVYAPHHVTVSGNRNLIPAQRPPAVIAVVTSEPPKPVVVATTPSLIVPPVVIAPPTPLPPTPQPVIVNPPVIVAATPAPAVVVRPEPAKPPPALPVQVVIAPPTPLPPTPQPVIVNPPVIVAATPAPAVVVRPEPAKPPPAPPVQVVIQPPLKPEPETIKVPPAEPVLASLATLKDIEQQRNPRRVVDVKVSKPAMKIGKDSLDLSIKSSHDGYIYMILLGSDAKSFYVLYPNGLDKNNAIKAGQTVRIPKPDWEVKAVGPVGTNNLLVMVSDTPRKLNTLTMAEPTAAEPFTYALNDIGGRSALINFLTSSDGKSESFGAKIVAIKEVK